MNDMYRVFGHWSYALQEYVDMGIMHELNGPNFKALAAIEDPYSYLDRLTIPKYIINACGDEFYLPDSPKHFFSDLKGPSYLRMVPNAEHSISPQDLDIAVAVGTWTHMLIHNKPMPRYSYTMVKSNSTGAKITVHALDRPDKVYLWYSSTLSTTQRDFRLYTCPTQDCFQPVFWFFTEIFDIGNNGTYVSEMNAPPFGWTGFLIELLYIQSNHPIAPEVTLKFTSEVNIVPDTYPFAPCGNNC